MGEDKAISEKGYMEAEKTLQERNVKEIDISFLVVLTSLCPNSV